MHTVRPTFASAFVLAGSLLLGGCPFAKTPTEASATVATMVTVVQGNWQSAQAGRLLSTPIVLRVVDANGRGVAKQVATLVVAAGGGSVDLATAVTDTSGEMRFRWTLGTASQVQALAATVNGAISVTVGATALFPSDMVVAQGGGQGGKILTVLKNDVVVRIVGPGNAPMVGIPVSFKVTAGGGGISPQSGTTNALGELSTKWTMGSVAGANTLVASSVDLPPATISATALP
jgi:hypothetical protein